MAGFQGKFIMTNIGWSIRASATGRFSEVAAFQRLRLATFHCILFWLVIMKKMSPWVGCAGIIDTGCTIERWLFTPHSYEQYNKWQKKDIYYDAHIIKVAGCRPCSLPNIGRILKPKILLHFTEKRRMATTVLILRTLLLFLAGNNCANAQGHYSIECYKGIVLFKLQDIYLMSWVIKLHHLHLLVGFPYHWRGNGDNKCADISTTIHHPCHSQWNSNSYTHILKKVTLKLVPPMLDFTPRVVPAPHLTST